MRVLHFSLVWRANRRDSVRGASWLAWLTILAGGLFGGILPSAAGATGLGSSLAEPSPAEPAVAQPASTDELGYSLTPSPSTTEPYAVCPPPAPGNAGCLSVIDPQPVKAASGYKARSAGPLLEGGGEKGGFAPKELEEAYKISTTGGSTQTVAIVDAYDDPYIESDLNTYREKYKVYYKGTETACTKSNGCFKKINQRGEEREYPTDLYPYLGFGAIEDWGLEMSLDVDMVSAACPECKILLVEANNRELTSLYAAENEAVAFESGGKKLATEVSNSWGSAEFSEEASDDTYFNHTDIPITASAGDSGYGVEYPAASKDVIAVGGTTLKKKAETERGWEETVWGGSGSGCSAYESKPAWQFDPLCSKRTDNDVAAVANNNESPVSVYDSYEYTAEEAKERGGEGETGKLGWVLLGGTSVASPLVAGVEAHATSTVKDEGAEAFYRHTLFDVTSGLDGYCGHTYLCEAGEGYNGPAGWGTPDGPLELTPTKTSAITEAATNVTASEAKLNGYVYTTGLSTTYHFEYGPTMSYGTIIPVPNGKVGTGATWQAVSQTTNDLHTLGGTYHYRLVATNSSGTVYGADHTLTTVPWAVQTTPNPSGSGESRLEGVSCSSSTACTAVSSYDNEAENTRLALIEAWNGTEWKIQATPKPTGAKYVWPFGVSCVSSTACTAVGYYVNSSEKQVPLAERWNGTEWTVQATPKEGQLHGVSCASSTECIAVGEGLSERWNGTEWSSLTGGGGTSISCTSSTFCMSSGGGLAAKKWNGTEWVVETVPSPTGATSSKLSSVSCTSTTACTAVGSYVNSSKATVTLAERWNGTEWSIQTTPNPVSGEGALRGVSCASSSECIAVGGKLSERWNGTEWAIEPLALPEEQPGFEDYSLTGISCVSSKPCTAVGTHVGREEGIFGYYTTLAERRAIVKPYAETKEATSISETGATLNGVVNPEGSETKYYFEYGPTKSYGSKTTEVNAGSGTSNLEESKAITGLLSDTEYHFRIVATSSGGTIDGADQVFSTIGKPTGETKEATSISESGATLNGIVNPRGAETKYYFEYGTTESYGSKTAEVSAGSGITNLEESKAITGLSASTTYDFRIVATNSHGTFDGANKTFSTTGKPTVETKEATNIGLTEATLHGIVNPRGAETKYYFEYGTTESYGSKTAEASAGSGTINVEESKTITGLLENTKYHFRIVATNSAGTSKGLDKTFISTPVWTIQSTPNPAGATESVLAGPYSMGTHLACSASTACTSVGMYKNSSGTKVTLAERWNGSEWSIQTTPNPSGATESWLDGVSCPAATTCTAVGFYKGSSGDVSLAEQWNGTEWSIKSTPNPSGGKEVHLADVSCSSTTACTAAGWYENSSSERLTLAERWNGREWSIQTTPNPEGSSSPSAILHSVSCPSSTVCIAVGDYYGSSGDLVTLAERWNGTEWSIQSTPNPEGETEIFVEGISCSSSTACTAVGAYKKGSGAILVPLAMRWNGTEWSIQTTTYPSGATENVLIDASCSTATACTAVGEDKNSSGTYVTLVEHWNGTEWAVQASPNPSGAKESELEGISCSAATVCLATGYYQNSSGTNVTLGETYG